MADWDLIDICEAHYILEVDYNCSGWLQERPSNRRRMEATHVQLHRMKFRPRSNLSYETLSDNGKEIYRNLVLRLGLPESKNFDVHIYAIVRVKVYNVKADSMQEALDKAEAAVDFQHLFPDCTPDVVFDARPKREEVALSGGYADEVDGYMVDQIDSCGNIMYERSQNFTKAGEPYVYQPPASEAAEVVVVPVEEPSAPIRDRRTRRSDLRPANTTSAIAHPCCGDH